MDSLKLQAGTQIHAGETFTLFSEDPGMNDESAVERDEKRIVSWLFNYQLWAKELLLNELGVWQDSFIATEVTAPFTQPNKKPGDIDVFICERDNPHQAIAIECKKVSVVAETTKKDIVHKVEKIGKGVSQANALRELGFYQTYLAIVTVVDGRQRNEYNTLHRSIRDSSHDTHLGAQTHKTSKRIYEFPRREDLHDNVGIIFIEVIQPTGKNLDDKFGVCISIDKRANPQEQLTSQTNRILDYINHP
ncbi:MAG TPA: hypothetical protein VF703_04125 [Pyrinomonadaceae bacterium]|jgi:hypothetical protein